MAAMVIKMVEPEQVLLPPDGLYTTAFWEAIMSDHPISAAAAQPLVEYRDVPGYPGYRVGSDGSFWSRWRGGKSRRPIHPWKRRGTPTPRGYLVVSRFRLEGGTCERVLHQLVLEVFVGPCPDGMEACHGAGGPADNSIGNLRWDTHSANASDAIAQGAFPIGESNGLSKLTAADVARIRKLRASGY